MRDLSTVEINEVSGGTLCLTSLFKCFSFKKCAPKPRRCAPKPRCEPKPSCSTPTEPEPPVVIE